LHYLPASPILPIEPQGNVMRYTSIANLLDRAGPSLALGPVSLVVLLAPEGIEVPAEVEEKVHVTTHDVFAENALPHAVNQLIDALAGTWLHYCYNAEYLFFPFCETRSIREMLAFHTEERREAMLTYVVDLYAGDLGRCANAVSLQDAWLDRSGYYALARKNEALGWEPKERQLDFFGGLRWRFEEHVPWPRRRIDRISLIRAKKGLRLFADFTLNDEEMNTYACPWHHNLTAAVCSFRTAKALRTNPGSRYSIPTFRWHNSTPFEWHSQQLMDLGLMEPGQWF
jgi:hypothetical protein